MRVRTLAPDPGSRQHLTPRLSELLRFGDPAIQEIRVSHANYHSCGGNFMFLMKSVFLQICQALVTVVKLPIKLKTNQQPIQAIKQPKQVGF